MKKYWLVGLIILPTLWFGCRQIIGQENLKDFLAEWKKLQQQDLPLKTPVVEKPHHESAQLSPLPKSKKFNKPLRVEDAIFNYIYKKLDLAEVFSTVCLGFAVGQENPQQCNDILTDCLNNLANAEVMKIKIKANKKGLKKIIKATKISLETSMSALIVLGEAIQLFSNLGCSDEPLQIIRIKNDFEQKIQQQYGDETNKIYRFFEVLFEYALDLNFFGK